jgi:hypothetical protein
MMPPDEHDDDLESEVDESAAIETEHYEQADDDEEIVSDADVAIESEPAANSGDAIDEEQDDEASDTI